MPSSVHVHVLLGPVRFKRRQKALLRVPPEGPVVPMFQGLLGLEAKAAAAQPGELPTP